LSAKKPAGRVIVALILGLVVLAGFYVFGFQIGQSGWIISIGLLGGFGTLRLVAALTPALTTQPTKSDAAMDIAPMWTILIALYKEADSVPSLLSALNGLEWRKDRLDIIFACERDDAETLSVLTALRTHYNFRIVRVPAGGPRTKPQ
ncbi:MAG: hypothetical protein HC777_03650, partial [Hyphomonadaceae bacterium]|nr:hypothetical protein [Hyphomonadaceae bacterium]